MNIDDFTQKVNTLTGKELLDFVKANKKEVLSAKKALFKVAEPITAKVNLSVKDANFK
jgi:hypothetical protein